MVQTFSNLHSQSSNHPIAYLWCFLMVINLLIRGSMWFSVVLISILAYLICIISPYSLIAQQVLVSSSWRFLVPCSYWIYALNSYSVDNSYSFFFSIIVLFLILYAIKITCIYPLAAYAVC